MDGKTAKKALRSRLRAGRGQRSPDQLEAIGRLITSVVLEMPQVRRARCIALYASVPGEPDTGPLRRALRERGVRVLLPVVRPDLDLDWAVDDGPAGGGPAADGPAGGGPAADGPAGGGPAAGGGSHGGIGGPEPAGPRLGVDAIGQADVVIAPALAVDTLGRRLGQGGGCYDRALGRTAGQALVFALVFDDEVLDARTDPVPAEPHDRAVPMVVTQHRWITLR